MGTGLSRLWAAYPRLAFVVHLIVTLMLGGAAVSAMYSGTEWVLVSVLVIGFILMGATLAFFTRLAVEDHWQPDVSSETPRLPSPRAAWASAQAQERLLWGLFAVAFLGGLVLGWAAKSVVGIALVVLSIPLALVAVRAGR